MYRLELINTEVIQVTEEHIQERVDWLESKIKEEELWRVPLLLECNTFAIMDGHHRYEVARRLGLKRIPSILLCYHNKNIQVSSWRDDFIINKDIILEYISQKKIFPHKTTKHSITPYPKEIQIPLSFLY